MRQEFGRGISVGRGAKGTLRCALLHALLLLACGATVGQQVWLPQAPGPNTRGQVENIRDGEVAGAIQAVAAHPSNPDIVYVGAVNGGIWRTTNARAARPRWERQGDGHASLSVGALEFDPTDARSLTLVAGAGRFSSFGGDGGVRAGLWRTTDGGSTWSAVDGNAQLEGLNISGVAARGAVIVVSANDADDDAKVGLWRSTDTGKTWKQISNVPEFKLPAGEANDLVGNPFVADQLFSHAGDNGVFRSDNAGATWDRVSDTTMEGLMKAGANNIKIAVGRDNNVYVAIVVGGRLANVFHSGNGGKSWTPMGVPTTTESSKSDYGIHPGGQGGMHLSIAADRNNGQLVYIGGDAQPCFNARFKCEHKTIPRWPNSIGARDFSGRLFRGDSDTTKPATRRWMHLTHSRTLGVAGGGTASGSAPHADSRDMTIAADGTLIEVNDGGIYRRTNPQTNGGDWFSMNGDIQVTEFHAVAWDAVSNLVIGGTQDTGTPAQHVPSDVRWQSISTSDGGVVAIEDTGTSGHSTRFSSFYELLGFRRQVYDASGALQSSVEPELRVRNFGASLDPQFYTPIKLNAVDPDRMIFGAKNAVYESDDQGDTVIEIGRGIRANDIGFGTIAYGAEGNPDVLYVGAGDRVFVRKAASPSTLGQSTAYRGGRVLGIALDPGNGEVAYVIDSVNVYRTSDAGDRWTPITGNLAALAPGALRSVAYSNNTAEGALVVGSNNGVFTAPGPNFNNWTRLGTGLPIAPVFSLEYDLIDHVLLAGTLGRGAWTLTLPPPAPNTARSAPARLNARLTAQDAGRSRRATPRAATVPRRAQPTGDMSAFQLRPGVLVNLAERRLYLMKPEGGMDAVALASGKSVWSTKVADKPLGVARGGLLAQVDPSEGQENSLKIAVLDRATGRQVTAGVEQLPEDVLPSVGETLQGEFRVTARLAGSEAFVGWQYSERPRRGIKPGTPDALKPKGQLKALSETESVRSGAFRLNLSTGATSDLPKSGLLDLFDVEPKALLPIDELPERPDETHYLSADERHFIVSRRVDDDPVRKKYMLTVYARDTKQRVGEFRSYQSAMPFFVTGTTIIYETGPYVFRTSAGLVDEPLKIRALDLRTGKELWSRQIRDTKYRGPFPP
jgi:photosystem II stability/assembly factor-like uncharacterized protein